jgi:hypothetical protein
MTAAEIAQVHRLQHTRSSALANIHDLLHRVICAGVWGGQTKKDSCTICEFDGRLPLAVIYANTGTAIGAGDNRTCADCAGIPNGVSMVDRCGSCGLPHLACTQDCAGVFIASTYRHVSVNIAQGKRPPHSQIAIAFVTCNFPGSWGGTAAIDACRICQGGGKSCRWGD